ncbi:MAG: phosphoglyceromutase [Bacteroidetes bacterium]|nr:phosphoglyceromutase [Bacteroidota bacterium]
MKYFLPLLLLLSFSSNAQRIENILIITTDGFRWQEVFKGMDSSIANNKKFNQGDSANLYTKYWAATEAERRKKLLPFIWTTMAQHGQIYGNRTTGNKVDNANPHWFSYPGYNEIFTGYPDSAINSNEYPPNPHTNLLEYLNQQPAFKNKVAAFGAWDAFNRILNEGRSKVPVFAAFDKLAAANPTAESTLRDAMLEDTYRPFGDAEPLDVFTQYGAIDYLKNKKPKVLYIAYGETDEWAHAGKYRDYLEAAHTVDKWISDLWKYIQSDPAYKNKTALFITVDHGRGDAIKEEWTSHNHDIKDSYQIWFAVMGPGIPTKGEVKAPQQLYQKQFAQTIAHVLGQTFIAEHPIGEKIDLNH